jgi:hypothetical protein
MEDATQHGGQETTLLLGNQGWLMGMVFVVVGTVRKGKNSKNWVIRTKTNCVLANILTPENSKFGLPH